MKKRDRLILRRKLTDPNGDGWEYTYAQFKDLRVNQEFYLVRSLSPLVKSTLCKKKGETHAMMRVTDGEELFVVHVGEAAPVVVRERSLRTIVGGGRLGGGIHSGKG